MSYWWALVVGFAVGAAAAHVSVGALPERIRPPAGGWVRGVVNMSLFFLSGPIAAAFLTDSLGPGLALWGASLIGGLIFVFFPVWIPESARPRDYAEKAILRAGQAGDKAAVASYLDAPDPVVRSFAAHTVRRHDWREYASELARRVGIDQNADVRASFASVLSGWAEPSTADALALLLTDSDRVIRRMAYSGLCRLGDDRALAFARELYATGRYLDRVGAVWGLQRFGAPEADALLEELVAKEASWNRRRQARGVIRRYKKDVARGKRL